MRYLLLIFLILLTRIVATAQKQDSIIAAFKQVNKKVTNQKTALISNRAMNVFLADKTSYAGENGDLSYYTNYVTFTSSTGILTINHNFQKAAGLDEPIKKLFSVGVKANIMDGLNAGFVDKHFENELGLTLNHTWLAKVKTSIDDNDKANTRQKHVMDALRAGIIKSLELEIRYKQQAFEQSLNDLNPTEDFPGLNKDAAITLIKAHFYRNLEEEYSEKFARLQAETLTKTNFYKTIKTHWTSLITYVPLAFPKFSVAASPGVAFNVKHPYPFELLLNHTHFWESSRFGKLFFTLSGKLAASNNIKSFELVKTNLTDYKKLGGTDTLHLASLKNAEGYLGNYTTLITPSLQARIVYFSHDSHVGISLLAQQNFGTNKLLNARLGIPVVLINSKKLPALNIEFQVSFFDLTKQISKQRKLGNNTSIGVGIGFPMSRIMY